MWPLVAVLPLGRPPGLVENHLLVTLAWLQRIIGLRKLEPIEILEAFRGVDGDDIHFLGVHEMVLATSSADRLLPIEMR